MKRRLLAFVVACAAAVPALAERADRDKPLNYEANSGECDDLKQICVLVGDVVLVKGTMRATGERSQAPLDSAAQAALDLLDAAP